MHTTLSVMNMRDIWLPGRIYETERWLLLLPTVRLLFIRPRVTNGCPNKKLAVLLFDICCPTFLSPSGLLPTFQLISFLPNQAGWFFPEWGRLRGAAARADRPIPEGD